VLTDGEFDYNANNQGQNCSAGYDLFCMQRKFVQLTSAPLNYGFTIIAFKPSFMGTLYPPGQKAFVLTAAIKKPVYIFLLANKYEDMIRVTKAVISLLETIKNQIDPVLEIRTIRISPIRFPHFNYLGNAPETLISRKFKDVIFSREGVNASADPRTFTYRRQKDMNSTDSIDIKLPFTVLLEPFETQKFLPKIREQGWLLDGKKSSKGPYQLSLDGESLSVHFLPSLTSTQGIGNTGAELSVRLSIELQDISNTHLWRDWSYVPSATGFSLKDYLGKTMYISDFIEYLLRYVYVQASKMQTHIDAPGLRIILMK